MVRRTLMVIALLVTVVSSSGCFYLFAGAAGGAGTAAWLSGKLSETVNTSFDRTLQAAKSALKSFAFEIEKETQKYEVAQLIAKHKDGRQIWVDVHRISDSSSKIEIRVGALGDKTASDEILKRIKLYL